jgi:hypothetical protein
MERVKVHPFWGDRFIPTALLVGVWIWYFIGGGGVEDLKTDTPTFVIMCGLFLLSIAGTMAWVFASCTVDDNGIRIVNPFRHYRIAWSDISRIHRTFDGSSRSNPAGKYELVVRLHGGAPVYATALTSRSLNRSQVQTIVAIARRNGMAPGDVPDDLVNHFPDTSGWSFMPPAPTE